MNLVLFEQDRDFIIQSLRHGQIDYLEPVTEALEAGLFRELLGRQILQRLAESFPSPRQKEEVPVWLYLASQISLRLHRAAGYHAFPYVIRTGGLLAALGPAVGRQAVHPDSGVASTCCPGFNHKNRYDRQTPCDQDFLRKFARDTDSDRLQAWFNAQVPRLLRSLKLFDAEGLFVGDASYVFVPDNEHYEHSAKLLFDEHNRPVDPNQADPRDRRYQWRRCYKLVSLIHVNRSLDFFLVVGARLAPGHQHECPLLYALVEEFLRAVGRGVMGVLIVDRGLLDGARMGRLKQDYQIDTVVPLKKNMDAYQDVVGLTRGKHFRWEVLVEPEAAVQRPARPLDPVLAQRERKRQATRAARQPAPASSPRTLLGLARGVSSWSECPVPLTAVIHREIDAQGQVEDWILVTTSASMSAAEVHATYQLRTAIEERHRQYKCFWDLAKMSACRFSLVVSQVLFLLLAYTLLEAHLVRRRRQELNRRTRGRLLETLGPTVDRVAVYCQQRFCLFSLPEFAEILLSLPAPARRKLLPKIRQLRRDLYRLLENARAP